MAANLTTTFYSEIASEYADLRQVSGDAVLDRIASSWKQDLPMAWAAAYAIAYARQTARVSGLVETKLRRLNGSEMLRLVEEVADRFGMTSRGVGQFLNERYG